MQSCSASLQFQYYCQICGARGIHLALSEANNSFILSFSEVVPSNRSLSSEYASSISSRRPFVSHAGRFGFTATFLILPPSLEGEREDSDPLDGGRLFGAGVARVALATGPRLFDNPADTIRLLGAAIARVAGALVLDNAGLTGGSLFELALLVIIEGFAANCFGAAALSARVILFVAGGFNPVSGSLRFAPPPSVVLGAMRWDVVNGKSSGRERMGGGPRMEGRLIIGEPSGEVRVRWILGDFSARTILLGDAIFEGCGSRESY